ncbi:MAG: hypothetical protein ACMG6E_09305, partial [Candidatus Roizmanbacteria bacterium]
MTDIQLKDLLATYNDIDDQISESIAAKHEMRSVVEGSRLSESHLFIWQRLIERILSPKTPYDSMALFWDVGSGKTIMAKELIKQAIKYREDAKNPDAPKILQKPMIIVRKAIEHSWADELVKDPFFSNDKIIANEFKNISDRRTAISLALKRFVTFKRLDKFAIELAGGKKGKKDKDEDNDSDEEDTITQLIEMSNDDIRKKYGQIPLVIIDEVHMLRENIEHVPGDYDEDGFMKPLSEQKKKKIKQTYFQITRFMQICPAVKVIMTGSPMADNIDELPSILNLILPLDNRIELGDFRAAYQGGMKKLLEYLEPKVHGRISYVTDVTNEQVPFEEQGTTFERYLEDSDEPVKST